MMFTPFSSRVNRVHASEPPAASPGLTGAAISLILYARAPRVCVCVCSFTTSGSFSMGQQRQRSAPGSVGVPQTL